jgi:hypothetical protein
LYYIRANKIVLESQAILSASTSLVMAKKLSLLLGMAPFVGTTWPLVKNYLPFFFTLQITTG